MLCMSGCGGFKGLEFATAVVLVVLPCHQLARAAPPQFEANLIESLDCPIGSPTSISVWGVNDAGHVVGRYTQCPVTADEAFLWTGGSSLITLTRPEGVSTAAAYGNSNSGIIVGDVSGLATGWRGFYYDASGYHLLDILPGATFSQALAVNDSLQIVGTSGNGIIGPGHQAFLWEDGVMEQLELPIGPVSRALDINNNGQIVGWMGRSAHVSAVRPFLWDDGNVIEFELPPGAIGALAKGVNDFGDAVGEAFIEDPDTKEITISGVLWTDGRMIDLGSLPQYDEVRPEDINNDLHIVGNFGSAASFLWIDGVFYDIEEIVTRPAGLVVSHVRGINNAGQIAGHGGIDPLGQVALLLTPVASLEGDITGDGAVGPADLAHVLGTWGICLSRAQCPADLNGDGHVGPADLAIVLGHWGEKEAP